MSKKETVKAIKWRQAGESSKHRYGIYTLVIALAITIMLAGLAACQKPATVASPTPTQTTGDLEIPRISAKEAKARLDTGSNVAIVDTRSKSAYERKHIAGAISIPLEETAQHLNKLGDYDEIITYCT